MSNQSPTAHTRDHGPDERPEAEDRKDSESRENTSHHPVKGTDTAATTNAEDMDNARRTTM
jgi:hypothetical protein